MQIAQDMWLELSRCAAMCYRRGGRRRNAALLRLEVAEALAAAGATREAVSLLAALAQEVLHEGWLSMAAALLVRLLQCSRPLTAVRKGPNPNPHEGLLFLICPLGRCCRMPRLPSLVAACLCSKTICTGVEYLLQWQMSPMKRRVSHSATAF